MANQHSKTTFWDRIAPSFGAPDSCWKWHLKKNWSGYGRIKTDGKNTPAHRAVYEVLVGPVPDGLQLDHLCHTNDKSCNGGINCEHRLCVNPDHLEPVTAKENQSRSHNARKTHCKNGHEFTFENLYIHPKKGSRGCKTCRRAQRLLCDARKRVQHV